MVKQSKQLSNPFSTGGGGAHFEAQVQAYFVLLMLIDGFAPCLPNCPIKKIKLQGKVEGYETDDMIIFVEAPGLRKTRKMLGQIKHCISITKNDKVFGEVIQAAWNDYNNEDIFKKDRDVIALITGPLSKTDINHVRTLLEWARDCENPEEYLRRVQQAIFSDRQQREKLKAFRENLNKANGGVPVTDEELFDFMRHFNLLGFDLDVRSGVTLSLLHSVIGQYSQENASFLWAKIVGEVQSANKNAGTISLDDLSEELQSVALRIGAISPQELPQDLQQSALEDWNQLEYASDLAIANLLGSWDENNQADLELISQLTNKDYSSWIASIREILQQPTSPISLKNGKWRVTKRLALWQSLGPRIFDDKLDVLKNCAIRVLCEKDPQFDLPVEERFAANIHGKVLKYSPGLRKGLAETLALLGNHHDDLTNCSQFKPESVAVSAVRELLESANSVLWGSLNDLLPILAEASPYEFLSAVENSLQQSPGPFDDLFTQENSGIWGRNYLTGLLWSLETLAWEEKFLVRACLILGELANHDPGGNWANRPANSLTDILLPWFPQTTASIEKRGVAVQTLQKEFPEIGWKLLLSLLPKQGHFTSGTRKPTWRSIIPADWKEGATKNEYWSQIAHYSEQAAAIAKDDLIKINELIGMIDDLPRPTFDKILEHLSSDAICSKPEEERLSIWNSLIKLAQAHRRFANAKWALKDESVSKIEAVAAKLAPINPENLYRRLFTESEDELYEENDNWDEQRRKIEERRQEAINEVYNMGGIEAVINFAQSVESPSHVGYSFGVVAQEAADRFIIPELLNTQDKSLAQFVRMYVWSRQYTLGWEWADRLDNSGWSSEQKGYFLSFLRFAREAWDRAVSWPGDFEKEYWIRAIVNPYNADGDLGIAIDKLIQFGRPHAAIECINYMLHERPPLDTKRSFQALSAALSSSEPHRAIDVHEVTEIIKAMQEDPETDPEDLFQVEWAYLPLLDRHRDASPKSLERRLASDPSFFCEVIRHLYRSKKEIKSEKEPNEQEQAIATNVLRLLNKWQTPPGIQADGTLSQEQFRKWLEHVKQSSTETGHFEVALTHVGQVLFYCPPDPDGLWIHRIAAEAINDRDAEKMRRGFSMEAYNSRGAHMVEPTGKPERELAEQYRQKAEDVENAGFQRFAAELRLMAESYDREAERIIAEHEQEILEDKDPE